MPLFMTRPTKGPNAAIDALAAVIDDEAEKLADAGADSVAPPSRKRRRASLGAAQIELALSGIDDSQDGPRKCAALMSPRRNPMRFDPQG